MTLQQPYDMNIRFLTLLIALTCLTACHSGTGKVEKRIVEDPTAMQMLQGIWLDDETEMPMMRIMGDTIYYADPQSAPVAFKVVRDSIYTYGNERIAYKIERQTEYSFWFQSLNEAIIKMHKSESEDDTLAFEQREVEVISTIPQVIQKDSVVIYNGTRYRGYVYINPSTMKVIRPSYAENGYVVDNVYYDNVIHICVYEGRNELYGRDILKRDFAEVVPEEQLAQMLLADMNFQGVNADGYQYQATLKIPETSTYTLVDLSIGFDKELDFFLVE